MNYSPRSAHTTVRPFSMRDTARAETILDEAFDIDRWTTTHAIHEAAKDFSLRAFLLRSTVAYVSETDGEVTGILLGHIDGQPKLPLSLRAPGRMIGTIATMLFRGPRQVPTLWQHVRMDSLYKKMGSRIDELPKTQLLLFAVAEGYRGEGIGTKLFNKFLAGVDAAGEESLFLETDSDSTFQFYESFGMTRVATESVDLSLTSGPHHRDLYLYAAARDEMARKP